MEMCHKLPMPCAPRCFPVLVLAIRPQTSKQFTVVQIPVDFKDSVRAMYSSGRNKHVFNRGMKKKKAVVG